MLFHNGNKFTAPNSQGGCADTYSSGEYMTVLVGEYMTVLVGGI